MYLMGSVSRWFMFCVYVKKETIGQYIDISISFRNWSASNIDTVGEYFWGRTTINVRSWKTNFLVKKRKKEENQKKKINET